MTHGHPKEIVLSPTVHTMGKFLFQLGGYNSALLSATEQAFVPFESSWAKEHSLAESSFNPQPDAFNVDLLHQAWQISNWPLPAIGYVIWYIVDKAQEHHLHMYPQHLAIEAALLVTPKGRPVWLSGGTQAGKTTLTVALALGLGWRIVSEDFVYVEDRKPVPLVAPLSLRQTAPDLLNTAIKVMPQPITGSRWLIRPDLFTTSTSFVDQVPVAIHLSLNVEDNNKLRVEDISWTQYLRTVLPVTNAMKVRGGIDQMEKIFENAQCMRVQNGDLIQRLDILSRL